jgi:chromatin remodeling complex protein RSC6
MVRTSKTTTAAAPAPAPVAAPAKKTKVAKKDAVVAAPAPVVEAEVADVSASAKLRAEIYADLAVISAANARIKANTKLVEKLEAKELRLAQKSKRKRAPGNKSPSGFTKPGPISDELATFLGLQKGVELARTAVSKQINVYIKEHNLKDAKNGRKINPDAKLAKLLKIGKDDELTFFNLQRYMKHHFPKAVVA